MTTSQFFERVIFLFFFTDDSAVKKKVFCLSIFLFSVFLKVRLMRGGLKEGNSNWNFKKKLRNCSNSFVFKWIVPFGNKSMAFNRVFLGSCISNCSADEGLKKKRKEGIVNGHRTFTAI